MKCHLLDTPGDRVGRALWLTLDPRPASAQWKLSPDFTSQRFAQVLGGP